MHVNTVVRAGIVFGPHPHIIDCNHTGHKRLHSVLITCNQNIRDSKTYRAMWRIGRRLHSDDVYYPINKTQLPTVTLSVVSIVTLSVRYMHLIGLTGNHITTLVQVDNVIIRWREQCAHDKPQVDKDTLVMTQSNYMMLPNCKIFTPNIRNRDQISPFIKIHDIIFDNISPVLNNIKCVHLKHYVTSFIQPKGDSNYTIYTTVEQSRDEYSA
jgi:hypothetical protein